MVEVFRNIAGCGISLTPIQKEESGFFYRLSSLLKVIPCAAFASVAVLTGSLAIYDYLHGKKLQREQGMGLDYTPARDPSLKGILKTEDSLEPPIELHTQLFRKYF